MTRFPAGGGEKDNEDGLLQKLADYSAQKIQENTDNFHHNQDVMSQNNQMLGNRLSEKVQDQVNPGWVGPRLPQEQLPVEQEYVQNQVLPFATIGSFNSGGGRKAMAQRDMNLADAEPVHYTLDTLKKLKDKALEIYNSPTISPEKKAQIAQQIRTYQKSLKIRGIQSE